MSNLDNINLADVEALADEQLAEASAAAGHAYTDGKLAVSVLGAEQRRRAAQPLDHEDVFHAQARVHTAVRDLAPAGVCYSPECQQALSHVSLCTCSCGGSGHGSGHKAHFPTAKPLAEIYQERLARVGGEVFALMTSGRDDDDADTSFGIVHTSRSNRAIDPEDMF